MYTSALLMCTDSNSSLKIDITVKLATSLREQGALQRSLEYFEVVRLWQEKKLGTSDMVTLGTMNMIASLLVSLSESTSDDNSQSMSLLERARELMINVLDNFEKILGINHLRTLDAANNLANLCQKLGK